MALPRNTNANSSGSVNDSNQFGPIETVLSCLWILTPLLATLAILVVFVAILTNQWLHTEEKMSNPAYNGTGDKEYLSKFTTSGLWTLCFTNPGDTLYECSRIQFFSKEEYSPDPNDSTMAIPYAVTKSAIFFVSAAFLLCCGYCCAAIGHCAKHKCLCTFVAGICFIVTGLLMLFGLIMYISIFKAEVGSKLRPQSQLQPPPFQYAYGYSFFLYVSGFVSTELAGITCVFLFIYRIQYDFHRKRHDGKHHHHRRPPPPINFVHFDHSVYYPCRRHPQAYVNSNSAIHMPVYYPPPIRQRRYFFGKDDSSDNSSCSYHRADGNSVKEFYDFPPPPTLNFHFEDRVMVDTISRHFPRDCTTTTVSTTADVNCEELAAKEYEDYSPSLQHEHEFVTFDLDRAMSLQPAHSLLSISSRNGAGKKGFESDSLRRTTPV